MRTYILTCSHVLLPEHILPWSGSRNHAHTLSPIAFDSSLPNHCIWYCLSPLLSSLLPLLSLRWNPAIPAELPFLLLIPRQWSLVCPYHSALFLVLSSFPCFWVPAPDSSTHHLVPGLSYHMAFHTTWPFIPHVWYISSTSTTPSSLREISYDNARFRRCQPILYILLNLAPTSWAILERLHPNAIKNDARSQHERGRWLSWKIVPVRSLKVLPQSSHL